MITHILNFIYKHELVVGITSFVVSFFLLLIFSSNFNTIKTLPIGLAWFGVFLIGDYLNRVTGEGSIFPHRKDQKNKIRNLILAALLMNFISDLTGAYLIRLWYYPYFNPLAIYSPGWVYNFRRNSLRFLQIIQKKLRRQCQTRENE